MKKEYNFKYTDIYRYIVKKCREKEIKKIIWLVGNKLTGRKAIRKNKKIINLTLSQLRKYGMKNGV